MTNIYADGCQWVRLDPPVGPTVDDLVTAWANVPDFAATAAVDVTVDGYAGKQIEFTVPDYNADECIGTSSASQVSAAAPSPSNPSPGFWAQGPNQHNKQWILDVDGTRLVITACYLPEHLAAGPSRPRGGPGLHPDRLNLTPAQTAVRRTSETFERSSCDTAAPICART